MYKSFNVIMNTVSFKVRNGDIVSKSTTKNLLINGQELSSEKVLDYFVFNDHIIYNTLNYCVIEKFGTVRTMKNINKFALNNTNTSEDNWLFTDIETAQKIFINTLNLEDERILTNNYNWGYLYLTSSNLFVGKGMFIQSLSPITGEYEWEIPLNRNGEIFKILGVRENELVVCWKRGIDYFALLGIDIQTGEIVWNIDDNFLLNGLSLHFTPNQNSLFSTKGEDRNSYFIEIDLQNKQAKRYGEIPDLCKAKLAISSSLLKDNLVYFTASTRHVFFPDTIGVFDYKTLEILWKHTFDFDKSTHLKNIEVDGNKLYVLDTEGILHIFEKEENG